MWLSTARCPIVFGHVAVRRFLLEIVNLKELY